MATLKKELREILDRYGIDPRDKSQLWDCHGTLVLYHRAYEIIAAKEAIRFDAPVIIEADSKDKIVAMLVTGHMHDRSEWSIGEAAPANCKNAYPYAMAEKRAKDRVIAKLAGIAAYVYSEAEADEFKDGVPVEAAAPPVQARSAAPPRRPVDDPYRPQARTSGQVLPVNPEEPPEVGEARRAAYAGFWARNDYSIDPAVIQGGMTRWDAEFLALAAAAPNLDALLKLKQDNKEAGFVAAWEGSVQPAVVRHFRERCRAIEKRLDAEQVAA